LAAVCLLLLPVAPAAATSRPRAVPPKPVYWGAWIGDQLTGTAAPWDMGAVRSFERMVGKRSSLVEFSAPFIQCDSKCHNFAFPTQQMQAIRLHGSIPILSWGSETIPDGTGPADPSPAAIAAGNYDGYLREFASEAAAWGQPFFLRFDWEMNGSWFAWGNGVNGTTPAVSVAAWRHVHDIFNSVGATNAKWVWCPYVEGKQERPGLKPFYPGSRYVDWTCMDGYNWGKNRANSQPWKSFSELFGRTYRRLTETIAPGKPVMIAEFASNSVGGNKASWISKMFEQLPTKFPAIRALVWFDSVDRGVDWPLETSHAAVRAFAKGIRGREYVGSRFARLRAAPVPTTPR
jgi:hypothetical protein